jgi:hypothetical protein
MLFKKTVKEPYTFIPNTLSYENKTLYQHGNHEIIVRICLGEESRYVYFCIFTDSSETLYQIIWEILDPFNSDEVKRCNWDDFKVIATGQYA